MTSAGTRPETTSGKAAERDAGALILALQAQRRLPRHTAHYWDQYCALLQALCRASAVLLVQRDGADWRVLGQECGSDAWLAGSWRQALDDLGQRALQNGYAFSPMQDDARRLRIVATVRTSGIGEALLVIDIPEKERGQLNEVVMRAMLAADFTEAPTVPVATATAPSGVTALATMEQPHAVNDGMLDMLDLAVQVMHEQRFSAATLLLVNGIAAHFGAAQVAFGWLRQSGPHTVAVSHIDRFEHNTQNIALLEDVFLEALEHSAPVWHVQEQPDPLLFAHARLARLLEFPCLYTLTIADAIGTRKAVLLLSFAAALPEPPASADLLLAMGVLQPWLQELQLRDRWWGPRLADWSKQRIMRWIGPGQVWGRCTVALLSLLLLVVLFGSWNYRVEALSQLTTDSTRIISAQFDSRIDEVLVNTGDSVVKGAALALLDTRELQQQEMDVLAERQRLSAEADKARAANNLAELEIAQARYAQADARLTRVTYYLSQARMVAPFDGVVIDGERKDLLNAPVKKGDKLFRVARIDGLYVEMLVPEREVRYVKPNATAVLRLLSRPDDTIRIKLSTFIPMAQVKGQEGNHFLIKAELLQAPEAWWRPGMSGIVLIDAGRQNIGWILTHKVLDTLRVKLWWLW